MNAGLPTTTLMTTSSGPLDYFMGSKVNLSTTVNQSMTQEVPMLSESELMPLRDRHVKTEGDEPMPETDITNAQLSALKAILDQDICGLRGMGSTWPETGA